MSPALGRRILSHCTTREVPRAAFLRSQSSQAEGLFLHRRKDIILIRTTVKDPEEPEMDDKTPVCMLVEF